MNLGICTFASGSTGNSYLIKSETTSLLVDAGISNRRIESCLREMNLMPSMLEGVLLTHEHVDHVKGIETLGKKAPKLPIYATEGTASELMRRYRLPLDQRYKTVTGGTAFSLGDIKVKPFNVSHDVTEAVGYAFEKGDKKISIVTDTGCISEEIFENIHDSDILVMEANHEVNLLLYGKYPYTLKQRILSDYGHLSNEACALSLIRFLRERPKGNVPTVLLAHLSKENNSPLQARHTVENMLQEAGFFVGKDLELKVAERDSMSSLMVI